MSWGDSTEKQEVGSTRGILYEELSGNGWQGVAGREWLLSVLSCAPAQTCLGPAPALREWVLLCLFPALMGKGETELERQREVRMDESGK